MAEEISLFIDNKKVKDIFLNKKYKIIDDEDEGKFDIVITSDKVTYKYINECYVNIPIVFLFKDIFEIEEIIKIGGKYELLSIKSSEEEIIQKIEYLSLYKNIDKKQSDNGNSELLEKIKNLNEINKKLFLRNKELENNKDFENAAHTYNKKYMLKRISEEISKVIRYERSFGVAVIDIDKECLKKYGFLKDEIYLKLTGLIAEKIRGSDVLGSLREGCFIILFPEIIEKYILQVIEKIILSVETSSLSNIHIKLKSGFFNIDKEKAIKYKRAEVLISICDRLINFAHKSNKKIVEYSENQIDSINKIVNFLDSNDEKHMMVIEELSKSQRFIEKLLPKDEIWSKKLNYSYIYNPFNFIGGDFFDFIEIDKERTAILFCDVSGHGVSSALYITAIKFIFRNLISKEEKILPNQFLSSFNKIVSELSEGNIFVATSYGYIDKKNKKFVYGIAGGTQPFKITGGKILSILSGEGVAAGLFEDFEYENYETDIDADDIILFYSDGIYEFLIENKCINDFEDFIRIVNSEIISDESKLISNIYKSIQEKTDNKIDFDDDLTLLAIKC